MIYKLMVILVLVGIVSGCYPKQAFRPGPPEFKSWIKIGSTARVGRTRLQSAAWKPHNYIRRTASGYALLADPIDDDPELLAKVDAYSDECKKKITDPPFGIEIESYCELTDYGWRFFLFGAGKEERLIYSKDAGKTVFEKRLPRGTVEKVIRSLPNPENL